MHSIKIWLFSAVAMFMATTQADAYRPDIEPEKSNKEVKDSRLEFREACENATAQTTQEINNIRAVLTTGGDVWWNGSDGIYVAPKVAPGEPEVSSIFAGAVWLGGVDDGQNLKLAAQTYGRASGSFDFYPGPLEPIGTTSRDTCSQWDRFFRVTSDEIDLHLSQYLDAQEAGIEYDPDLIPDGVKGWPARGNQFFFDVWRYELPNTTQGLAGFFDQDGDGNYDPDLGDYPIIEIRGCPEPQYPDEMIFWIYNDNGDIHRQSQGDPIQMEIQVQAFSYATNDVINNMTFQRYKLINRAVEPIDSMFFAMWVDPDLGCYEDDYIGCDTVRSLGYVYNADAVDGISGCACQDVNTYCTDIPLLGVDYFRGPLNEFGDELGMSSFTYYNNGGFGNPIAGTTDPGSAIEYYRYLSGSWRDGSPFTFGDDAYQDGDPIKYAFVDDPDEQSPAWSMCTATLPEYDRRTIQASGPFRLEPGAVNELIIGVVWVAEADYPCPDITRLQAADDIAQALFDNCFELTDGPDAPDVDWIELDQELIAVLTNKKGISNNFEETNEDYSEAGLNIPPGVQDSNYVFEGYRIFQFSGPDVSLEDREDPNKVREIAKVDVVNGVTTIFNWEPLAESPGTETFLSPTKKVDGTDSGVRHTFRITSDAFADGDARLINHKKYYFVVVAYAYNNWQEYDYVTQAGQPLPYLEGRRNIGDGSLPYYTVIPRKTLDRKLNAVYGDGPEITRIDGIGTGRNFLEISEESRGAILDGNFDGSILYKPGQGPIQVQVYNPLDVVNGNFEVTFFDEDMDDDMLGNNVRWQLRNLDDPNSPVIVSEQPIDRLNEQIISEYGITVSIGQVEEPGNRNDDTNGNLGREYEYVNGGAFEWFDGIPDDYDIIPGFGLDAGAFNYIATGANEPDQIVDQNMHFSRFNGNDLIFTPFYLNDYRNKLDGSQYVSGMISSTSAGNVLRGQTSMDSLNNVDIIFTSNKDLWSRCVVIETASRFFEDAGLPTQGGASSFDPRQAPSVTKNDSDGDGMPDVDPDESRLGFGWFPGYAIDVETGQRLNIFFGENSFYDTTTLSNAGGGFEQLIPAFVDGVAPGGDMMLNPSRQELFAFNPQFLPQAFNYMVGGQHWMYVTRQPYDGCEFLYQQFNRPNAITKINGLKQITWTALLRPAQEMLSYADGLIPEDLIVKLRVENPYQVRVGTGEFNGYPSYQFTLEGVAPSELTPIEVESALNEIRVVPNPYYSYSQYENSSFDQRVKITNLPARCTVTIYTLDGKFIRQYERNETNTAPAGSGIESRQYLPDLDWDLKNNKGIPVASGVYLIHVDAKELGERTLKWFGTKRPFDPSAN